jgi:hypothetical protein
MLTAACMKESEVQNCLLLDSSIFSDLVPPCWRFLAVMAQAMPATNPRPSVVARRVRGGGAAPVSKEALWHGESAVPTS